MTKEALMRIGENIMAFKGNQPTDGKTFCNVAARTVALLFGCNDFPKDCMANAMYDILLAQSEYPAPHGWCMARGVIAADHAARGKLALAAKKYPGHGHIVLVAPFECELSHSWKKIVPMVYNVGVKNGLCRASQAFPVADGEPDYFLWS